MILRSNPMYYDTFGSALEPARGLGLASYCNSGVKNAESSLSAVVDLDYVVSFSMPSSF
jgi:hypothetical protein